uniref:Starch-binding protein SusD n=1 Tax=uncultured Muribaculaceae bacterium TaxID=2301481 RepID=A0A6G8F3V2_9BACT|nr:starch-binding protein SusD [uncultured Muribaculaceae bacterium]
MNLKKYLLYGGVALGLGLTSCVGDLDLQPNDPNLVSPSDPDYKANSLAMCYSGIAVSGISGPGSSYVSGLDAGTTAYLRLIFTLSEFCSDELLWIWPDAGVSDITSCTWSSTNSLLEGAYYRLLGHIAICNQYLANTAGDTDAESVEMRAEARVLRAYSYYNMIDLFGQSSFITEDAEVGASPVQKTRKEVFDWIEGELKDIVDNKLISENPVYGRVGLDGAEALLARLYLNAEVFSGTGRWEDCQKRCENIIARHQGGGFQGSGLANHYLYLFSRDNNRYMPGGANKAENEILFGIAFDSSMTQSYGGPTFIIASTITNSHYIPRQLYGCSGEWSCIRGCYEMAERFYGHDTDVRDDLWVRGLKPAGTNPDGTTYDAEDYTDRFIDFTGAWATTGGNAIIKFTGRTTNSAADGGWDMSQNADGTWNLGFDATPFASTDQPIIRLADIYLMYAECYVNGSTGDRDKALNYVNIVRRRAGAPDYGFINLTKKGIMDERSRELYLESTRRSDLIRNGMFTGPSQTVWQYKGSMSNNQGTRIAERNNLYPIPQAVISAQPEFQQNPGY